MTLPIVPCGSWKRVLCAVWVGCLVACSRDAGDTGQDDTGGAGTDASTQTSTEGTRGESESDTTGGDSCVPTTCASLGLECGEPADGCGGQLECGSCDDGGSCSDEGLCIATGELASSVSQYGITWTFDGEYLVGRFVTGDWWVVGPLTIESVAPAPGGGRNGSMLDPVGPQAYDARGGSYSAEAGLEFPLPLEPNHSLVSAISHPEEPDCDQGGTPGWLTYSGSCQRGPIATQAVLTVLAEPPPASAFRPPYAGADKPLHLASTICWDSLPDLPAPGSLPDAEATLRHVERPWIDHLNSWTMQHGCATLNMFCYGREIGDVVSTLAAFVLVDSPHREDVALRLVQLGIDNYGVLEAGGGWGSDGGHFNGRKFPIVFAGGLLGDAAMASPGTAIGNEDAMTYHGAHGGALWGRQCTNCYFEAGCSYTDACPNGARDCKDPAELVDGCSDYRNCCTSRTWVGEALAIHLMGLADAWDHAPFFEYVDRWMTGDVPGGGGTSNAFVEEMWTTHRRGTVANGCGP
jgi:hypothetical protein